MSETQPVISVDPVALTWLDGSLRVVVHRRAWEPFAGELALPGVMLSSGETVRGAAVRGLSTKGGVRPASIRHDFAGSFDDSMNRDPRGATISLSTILFLEPTGSDVQTCSVTELPVLPFAHGAIIARAIEQVADRILVDTAILPALLGQRFTTASAGALLRQVGIDMDPANITRSMRDRYTEDGRRTGTRGRPSIIWTATRRTT